jgi:hypothetical protein
MPKGMDFMRLPDRSMHLPQMVKSRQMLTSLKNMKGCYTVLVMDIGAYTTDFGLVRFDTTFNTDLLNRPQIIQASYPAGIGDLDAAVFNELSKEKQVAIRGLSTSDWEKRKPALYRGEEVALPDPRGGIVKIGRGRDAAILKEKITSFSERIWELRNKFLGRVSAGQIHCHALTGGGSLIPGITDRITSLIAAEVGKLQPDLLGALENLDLTSADPHSEAYRVKSRELMRGGSAVGGASVFFE